MFKNIIAKISKDKRSTVLYVITVALSAVLLVIGNKITYDKETVFLGGYEDGACTAKVTEILERKVEQVTVAGEHIGENKTVYFRCEIKNGDFKGETVEAYESMSVYDTVPLDEVKTGDRVLITRLEGEEGGWYLFDYDRTIPLWVLGIAFIVLLLLFGRKKGVNTVISLGFTCAAVFVVFVPSVLSERNVYFWSIVTCIYIIAMTLTVTEGYSKKTLAAVIGCTSGVVVAGLLTLIADRFLNLTGVTSEDTIYIKMNFNLDLNALIFAGIILGAVGAVMDVSVSISSSLKELYDQIEEPTFGKLFKSGITIGRDIMGTMANTLVLAYIGCELSATLIQVVYSSSLLTMFSREKIVAEMLQALVGSIGILLTIPLTAAVSSARYTGFHKTKLREIRKKHEKYDKYYVEPAEEPSLYEHMDDN